MLFLSEMYAGGAERSRSKGPQVDADQMKPEWIFEAGNPLVSDVTQILINANLRLDAQIDIRERYVPVVNIATRGMDEQGVARWNEEKTQQLMLFTYGNRIGNELRRQLIATKELGPHFHSGLTDATYDDHNVKHYRPVEGTQAIEILLSEHLDDPEGVFTIASGMFAYTHDIMQLLRRVYNDSLSSENQRRDPRALHEEEAAIFVKACTTRIAQAGHMDMAFAGKVTSVLATMILMHDKHDAFRSMIEGMRKGNYQSQTSLKNGELHDSYTRHELNFLTLTDAQWIDWFTSVRKQKENTMPKKLPVDPESKYGLIPWVEHELKNELEALTSGQSGPFSEITDAQMAAFSSYEDINILADIFNMGYPSIYAFLRKYCGSVKDRAMAQVYTDAADATDIQHADLVRSDWARSMVEYVMMVDFLSRTPFWQNTHFRETMVNTVLISLVQTDAIYGALMEEFRDTRGTQWSDHKQISTIEILTLARVKDIAFKAIEKHKGIPDPVAADLREATKEFLTPNAISNAVLSILKEYDPRNINNDHYDGRYSEQVANLLKISEIVMKQLHDKPKPEIIDEKGQLLLREHGVRKLSDLPPDEAQAYEKKARSRWEGFSRSDIDKRVVNRRTVIKYILSIAGRSMTDEQIEQFEKEVYSGMEMEDTFSVSTVSLGRLEDSNTVHQMKSPTDANR